MTVPVLDEVNPSAFLSFGFHGAEPYAANAARYFRGDVERVTAAGQVWWGEGQPQAASVMKTNAKIGGRDSPRYWIEDDGTVKQNSTPTVSGQTHEKWVQDLTWRLQALLTDAPRDYPLTREERRYARVPRHQIDIALTTS